MMHMVVIKKTLILWTIVLTETHTYCIAIFICSINRQDLIVAKGKKQSRDREIGVAGFVCVIFIHTAYILLFYKSALFNRVKVLCGDRV